MADPVARWRRLPAAGALIAACGTAPPALAQSPARFSLDSVAAVDVFRGQNAADRPNIIVDVTAVVRLGNGWLAYVRPWFRQPRVPEWDKEIYQAALQYERPGLVATRIDLGYIVSPIGLGMMDTRPGVNPTIAPHLSYFTPMPVFDPEAPRIRPIASSYPLGAQLSTSTTRWDARVALVNSAPVRSFVLNGGNNPPSTPVVVAGAGITPVTGLRLGLSVARGTYVKQEELRAAAGGSRSLTMVGVEAEYSFGYTKMSGELVGDRLESAAGVDTAYAWFVQAMQTLSPRWFVAARQAGASSPPLRSGTIVGTRSEFHTTEATLGVRLSTDFTLRGSFMSRKAYARRVWDQQLGASLVWAHRWW